MERLRCNKGGANVNNKYGKDRVLRTRRFPYTGWIYVCDKKYCGMFTKDRPIWV